MWELEWNKFSPQQPQTSNNVYNLRKLQDIVKYLHLTCGSPPKSTWVEAIKKGFFTTWPGITAENVNKYLTDKHMKQHKQNIFSTKTTGHAYAAIIDCKKRYT